MLKLIKKNKLLFFVLFLFMIYITYFLIVQEIRYHELEEEQAAYEEQIDALQEEITTLIETIEEAGTDEYIKKMARERLKMVFPNEIIFKVE